MRPAKPPPGCSFVGSGTKLELRQRPEDMNLPGFGWHPLKGARKGTYAVEVSGNWRLTYRFSGTEATDVDLEDYH